MRVSPLIHCNKYDVIRAYYIAVYECKTINILSEDEISKIENNNRKNNYNKNKKHFQIIFHLIMIHINIYSLLLKYLMYHLD